MEVLVPCVFYPELNQHFLREIRLFDLILSVVSFVFILNIFLLLLPPGAILTERLTALLLVRLFLLKGSKLIAVERLRGYLVDVDEALGAALALFFELLLVKLTTLARQIQEWKAFINRTVLYLVRDVREHIKLELLRVFLASEGLFLEKRDVEFVLLKLVPQREPLKERCSRENPQKSLLVSISVPILVGFEEVLIFVVLVVVVGVQQLGLSQRLAVLMLQPLVLFLFQLIVIAKKRREKPEECFSDLVDIRGLE